ncbi:hypothetical protein AB870_24310 (plasmid) [Pandoraea faecigallinarum]|uniref:Gamma-soluble NSF attachment protein n=1 Tax=Pandoraea faecigallinarum TaxID=656179 RepID=A0A0H3X3H2_9BURK|nr:hypothetical protein [Pandoraea faecigallinarum]AKM33321.1 hypothetical protein AB870_24310 [Pandoraea faecigallinarum]
MVDGLLTIRRFFRTVPLVSPDRHKEFEVALADLKFDDEDAVLAAYDKITHMGGFDSFCDWVFHLGDKTTNLRALATLTLCKLADDRKQKTHWIPGSRQEAVNTLAGRLSPSGIAALLETFGAKPKNHEFLQFLAESDRYCMAGAMYLGKGGDDPSSECDELAADAYAQAVVAYTRDGRYAHGLEICASVAGVYTQAGEPRLAAAIYLSVAQACTHAAKSDLEVAAPGTRPNWHSLAAEAYEMAARIYDDAGLPEQVAAAYAQAAAAYMQGGRQEEAANTYMRVAQICTQIATAYEQAAKADNRAGLDQKAFAMASDARAAYEMAGTTYEMAAKEHAAKPLGLHSLAAQVDERAAQAYENAGKYELAANAYMRAGQGYSASHDTRAVEVYEKAVTAYTRAGRRDLAAIATERLAQAHEQAEKPTSGTRKVTGELRKMRSERLSISRSQ